MIDSFTFFVIWLTFTILVICVTLPFLIWAIRSGHFTQFDYASRLALKSKIVEDKKTSGDRRNKDVSA
jgi:hypothetical protein